MMLLLLPLFAARSIADVDWEVVLSIAFGLGAAAYAVLEHRRTTKLDGLADHMLQRIAALEAVASPDITSLDERLSFAIERQISHAERIATLEARADYHHVKATKRGPDGKFASPHAETDPK